MAGTYLQGCDAVEVRFIRLNAPPGLVERLDGLLDEDEQLRARRFRFPHLTAAFVQSHAALRILVGQRLGIDPRNLAFSCGPFGKPDLLKVEKFEFNLSHSGGMAGVAFAFGCQIGVDVETHREAADWDAIVERYFSAAEIEEFRGIEAGLRVQAFYNGWTRKEAYIKARGGGLSIPLDSFSVNLRPGTAPAMVHVAEDSEGRETRWQLQPLEVEPGYAGALVYSGERRAVSASAPVDMESVWDGWRNPEK